MSNQFDDFSPNQDDFGISSEFAALPICNFELSPWEKPRKQWIRKCQWWNLIERHLIQDQPQQIALIPLRYFGLPGERLLDIRFFLSKLKAHNKSFFFYGINNSNNSWSKAQVQLSQVLDIDNGLVVKSSSIGLHDFDELHHVNPTAMQNIKKNGPFDVINLDFCDSVISKLLDMKRLDAIKNLLNYQLKTSSGNWLLFITTRTAKNTNSAEAFERLSKLLDRNLQDADFKDEFIKYYNEIHEPTTNKIISTANITENDHINIVVIGFVKWLFGLAVACECSGKLLSILRYDIDDTSSNDMMSMCLSFKKDIRPLHDPSGVTTPCDNQVNVTEPELAKRSLKKIYETKNVDSILTSNLDTYKTSLDETLDLLNESGVDTSSYISQLCRKDLVTLGITEEELIRKDSMSVNAE
ncbi:PP_RS20740 family protein [Serratia aquatilis]|uniref:Uncharacterized protein n=1 Tax=Serratia aquatilis TaxID=1737515 RepID=A0ABV6EG22_9GAMM